MFRLASMLLMLALFSARAPAESGFSLGEAFDRQAQEAVRLLGADARDERRWAVNFTAKWDRICGPNAANDCVLHECDVIKTGCRPGRILLFRGEDRDPAMFSLSAMARNHWRGVAFSPMSDAPGLLARLKRDVALFRPVDRPPVGGPVVLDPLPDGSRRWVTGDDADVPYRPGATGTSLTFLQILAFFHAEASYLYFNDPRLGPISIDPLISYSASPRVAIAFGHKGRLIVLSVPETELVPGCGDDVPEPARVVSAARCASATLFPAEREFDVILYPNPEHVWKSFALGPGRAIASEKKPPAWMRKFQEKRGKR